MSIITLEDKARKALDEQFRIKPPVGQAEEVKFLRISDAVPLTTMTANCPLCSVKWTSGHSLLFFMEKMHHDNIIEVLKFHIGLANRVEAMATRLATTGGENLFHEKDVVQLFKEMYEKGPAAVDFAFGIVGYYVSHQREYEGTKRSVKIELDEVLEHFSGVAEFYQAKAARFRELWGDRAQAKMEELYGEEAAADLRRVRSLVFRDEALMNGEMEKVQELLHEDPMQWIKALAAAGVQPVQSPALPSPPPAQKGGK